MEIHSTVLYRMGSYRVSLFPSSPARCCAEQSAELVIWLSTRAQIISVLAQMYNGTCILAFTRVDGGWHQL